MIQLTPISSILGLILQIVAGWSLGQMAITAVVIIGICAIVYAVAKAAKFPIPDWFIHIVFIVLLVCFAIAAIRFILSA